MVTFNAGKPSFKADKTSVMAKVLVGYAPLDVQNVVNVAVVTAFAAICAIFPLNCTAGHKGEAAESTFSVGGRFAAGR